MHKFTFITLLLIFNIWFNDTNQKYKKAYFASGCFWCVESIYENLKGVKEVNSGYSGGKTTDPTYRQVMSGRTGHAEAIEVIYNPSEITFKTLVNVFFGSHDPTTLNKQGPDRGTQYRSIAFYENSIEKEIIENSITELLFNKTYYKITTEVLKFKAFYLAEEYHQDYKKKNPYNPYILNVSAPRINKFKIDYSELLK
ncbi:MAG: peptide-methionine (S)-S-oxide reductase [Flavobacteriales bacterium]|jgi:peptide-methionine (S)-S-oxide reductase|nr:peptide-methionine (S)-S-oxide reductase [Flavobacteriaceae bacterium]MDB3927187.1 peptide-methionine (S)-S-oxide reductase MsrA [Flavobacteriaceae bacterium]RZP09220.1 MAG: peptide-methionine (S)-S-oxide reductase [Flavobacteriales bacterium]|tara:strand:- start:1163 stop:1756 length:594 start_codon:yes stop_codon:yes gene_type:complete